MAQPFVTVKPYVGVGQVAVNTINPNGRAAAADSQPTTMATEDKAVLDAVAASVDAIDTNTSTANSELSTVATNTSNTVTALGAVATNTGDTVTALSAIATAQANQATAALQTTGNASLTTIAGAVAGGKVKATTADGDDATLGAKADASAGADTGTFSLMAFVKWIASKIKAAGQATMANSHPVVIASDQTNVPVVTTLKSSGPVEFTRPADTTAYAASDVVGPVTTPAVIDFGAMFSAVGKSGYIVRAKVFTDQVACVAQFRLYLYKVAPTPIADNSPFTLLYANASKQIGFIDFPAAFTEGAGSTAAESMFIGQLAAVADAADSHIYGVLVTKTAFTPASGQKIACALTVDQN